LRTVVALQNSGVLEQRGHLQAAWSTKWGICSLELRLTFRVFLVSDLGQVSPPKNRDHDDSHFEGFQGQFVKSAAFWVTECSPTSFVQTLVGKRCLKGMAFYQRLPGQPL
jgi:hypothetical protein